MRTLGLIGGMSWESTAIYYRLLNEETRRRRGGLHSAPLLVWSFDFAEIAALQRQGDWAGATNEMIHAARSLRDGGAEALLICTNTMHKMAAEVEDAAGMPVLHIADATGRAIRQSGLKWVGLLATRFTMEQDFYVGRLRDKHGVEAIVPDDAGRTIIHDIIYQELCQGIVREASRIEAQRVVAELVARGAEGVILGCTEICMLLGAGDVSVPVFDTTQLHAQMAVDWALSD